jgi:hypothetical protein
MKKWITLGSAILLVVTLATPALAGAPGEGKKAALPQGGLPPTTGGLGTGSDPGTGWTEYPTRPATAVGGAGYAPYSQGQTQGEVWPPFLGDIFGWVNDNLNPGKWASDTINGALAGLLRTLVGFMAQIVYWIYGRDVANPYVPGGPESSATGGGQVAAGLGLVLHTPPEYTYESSEVGAILPNVRAAALLLLGLALTWLAIRELIRLSTGEAHGYHVGENVRRVVVATFLAAGGGYWLVSQMIQLNNVLITAVVGDPLTDVLRDIILFDRSADLLLNVGLIVETAVGLLLLLVFLLIYGGIMLGRIILLDVLLLFAPLAGAAYATEETEYIFTTWIRVAVGAVFYQFIGTLFLELGGRLMGHAWSGQTGGNPLLLAALSITTVFMAISGPPILGFAIGRAASSSGAQRMITRIGIKVAAGL